MIQQLINHVVFVLDKSGSMSHLTDQVIKVFDTQVNHLAKRSKELNQETRVSVYKFSSNTECLVYDIDCLRLPSIRNYYQAGGNTALIDATLKAIEDLKQTPELYGDHAFLIYTLTDGEENSSENRGQTLSKVISELPDNWTVSCLVPDQNGVHEAKKFGFLADNISVWTTTNKGVEEVGKTMMEATDNFMRARATGVRSTKSLFKVDASNLSTTQVKQKLQEITPSEYEILDVRKDGIDIKSFVESWKLPFRKGGNYYELMKPETVQQYKQILVQEKLTGKIFGGTNGRDILGLPNYEVKVSPGDFNKYKIFVQSTSTNRKLVIGTQLVVLK